MPVLRRGRGKGRGRGVVNWPLVRDSFNTLRDELGHLEHAPTLVQVMEQLHQIRADIGALNARFLNSRRALTQPLVPIRVNGQIPAGFPATGQEIFHLSEASVDVLLLAYNLPIQGDVLVKQALLASYLGTTPASG